MVLSALLAGLVIGSGAERGKRPSEFSSPRVRQTKPREAQSVKDLLEQAHGDIAHLNLLCARGLPGSEHLDVKGCLSTLDAWADRVRSETTRYLHLFQDHPEEYDDSLGFYRMMMLVTVLQQDFGVHYNPACVGNWDFSNSQDVFINGLLGPNRSGTCSSMPVLYVAVGRRLGYPLKLAPSKGHLFVRWEDEFTGGERFNIEATSRGIISRDDEYYSKWPKPLSPSELNGGYYLHSLDSQEELSEFLILRGNCLEDNRRLFEAQAAYAAADQLGSRRAGAFLASVIGTGRSANHPLTADVGQGFPGVMPMPQIDLDDLNAQHRALLEFDPLNPNLDTSFP